MWLVIGLGSLVHTKMPSPDVAFVCVKRYIFPATDFDATTLLQQLAIAHNTLYVYLLVAVWLVVEWCGLGQVRTTLTRPPFSPKKGSCALLARAQL